MTELLVGTRKGLFVLEGEPGSPFEVTARAFAGEPVEYAVRDPRSGRLLASVTSPFYGPKIFYADDPAGEWEQASGVELPRAGDAVLERIWVIVPGEADGVVYAGGDPGVLFESRDGGATSALNRGAVGAPDRDRWQPGAGGLCLHSIATWPGEPDRLAVAHLGRRHVADRRRRSDVAQRQRRDRRRATCPRMPTDGEIGAVRPPHPARAEAARAALHAVPRRRLSLRRRRRVVERHRARPAVGLRLPARDRPRRPRQRVRDPARRRHRPRHARRARARVRDARRGRELDPARRRPAGRERVPDDPARGVRQRRGGRRARALLRRDVGCRLRVRATRARRGSTWRRTCRPSRRSRRPNRGSGISTVSVVPHAGRRVELELAVERVDAVAQPARGRCRSRGPRRRRRRRGSPGRRRRRPRARLRRTPRWPARTWRRWSAPRR